MKRNTITQKSMAMLLTFAMVANTGWPVTTALAVEQQDDPAAVNEVVEPEATPVEETTTEDTEPAAAPVLAAASDDVSDDTSDDQDEPADQGTDQDDTSDDQGEPVDQPVDDATDEGTGDEPTLPATITKATVTIVNDDTSTSSKGEIALGSIAANAAALAPSGLSFLRAEVYGTTVTTLTLSDDGQHIVAANAAGNIANISIDDTTDIKVYFASGYDVAYKFTLNGSEISASSAPGSFTGSSVVKAGQDLNFSFAPEEGYSVDVSASAGKVSKSGNVYSVSGIAKAATVTIAITETTSYAFRFEGSNAQLGYGNKSYKSQNGYTGTYGVGQSLSFTLTGYNQWSNNARRSTCST